MRRAVHERYRDELLHSMAVGVTHWEDFGGGGGELPGPPPTLFFAPDRIVKRSEDWGADGLLRATKGTGGAERCDRSSLIEVSPSIGSASTPANNGKFEPARELA